MEFVTHIGILLNDVDCFSLSFNHSGNEIKGEGAKALCRALLKNTSLIKLNVQGKKRSSQKKKKQCSFMFTFPDNEIGDLGAEAFAQLIEKNTSIREICLSCTLHLLNQNGEQENVL